MIKFLVQGHAGRKWQSLNLSSVLILNSVLFSAVLNTVTNKNKNSVVLFVKQISKVFKCLNFFLFYN